MLRFRIIALAILLWNLIGLAAYVVQASADLDEMSAADPVMAEAFMQMPAWAWAAYALAVWGGTFGAVLLLMRRNWAWFCFALSLAGIVIQFGWSFLGFDMIGAKGLSTLVLPLTIFAIGVASLLYARRKCADGTLT